ncbi:Capsule biosynthesis protein CapA [Thermoflexales bacterium]|nr:Capsule biosynthesis protein CapA [Thermoflexales bacterium]
MKKILFLLLILALATVLTACGSTGTPTPTLTPTIPPPTATSTPPPTPTATPAPMGVFTSGALPEAFRQQLNERLTQQTGNFVVSGDPNLATLQIAYAPNIDVPVIGQWVYALVAPFPTVVDDVPLATLQDAWQGLPVACDACDFAGPLRLSESTLNALKTAWGEPAAGAVEVLPSDQITPKLWEVQPAWGIVPFDELNPRLKVLSIDGRTPFLHGLDLNAYPLAVKIGIAGPIEEAEQLQAVLGQPLTNRDESKMTLVAMTGVTAMARDFAASVDVNGVLYPAKEIKDWFDTSDIVHISNENSFWPDCPKQPTPNRGVFCSDPSYWELLKYIGTDVIELDGNHLNDYGWEPFSYTLDLYEREGVPYYGGGRTVTEATRYITLAHNGNVLAFAGCNPVGPAIGWADGIGDGRPGSAPCASPYLELQEELKKAKAEGAVVFSTLQYNEQPLGDYSYETALGQAKDFERLLDAGADVVSGSQGHSVQGFGLKGNGFMHFGVGNLFFDQMQARNLRENFIDRYLIYDNKLLGVELLTTIRDEAALPRKMTLDERRALLKTLFSLSYWE